MPFLPPNQQRPSTKGTYVCTVCQQKPPGLCRRPGGLQDLKLAFVLNFLKHVTVNSSFSLCLLQNTAITAELTEMLFGRQTRVDPRNHVLVGVHVGATWRI